MTKQEKENQWLLEYIEALRNKQFYGRLEVNFKAGEIYLIREERTLKPPRSEYISI